MDRDRDSDRDRDGESERETVRETDKDGGNSEPACFSFILSPFFPYIPIAFGVGGLTQPRLGLRPGPDTASCHVELRMGAEGPI